LQNLFGEGVLSASFIPVYARLLAEEDTEEARRVAGATAGLLGLTVALVVAAGIAVAPLFVTLVAPGFQGAQRAETIHLVRILFPGIGLLVLSAWCLGILNSHRRFFVSYAAPVVWNVAIIGTMLLYGHRLDQYPLARATAWGAVVGSALQFLVQLPTVLRLAGRIRVHAIQVRGHVATVVRNFFPAFAGRGVNQISAYVDTVLGSLLPGGAVAALGYALTLSMLPVSLFGMSVSAAELPTMSSLGGGKDDGHAALRARLDGAGRRVAFFVVPSAIGFLAFGDLMSVVLYQSGAFTADTSRYVWSILAGSAVGLVASTLGRLYSSAFYALHDTRTPLRYAVVRVVVAVALGVTLAFGGPGLLGVDPKWGVAGITAGAGVAAWVEFTLLRRRLARRIGGATFSGGHVTRLYLAAAAAAGVGWGLRVALGGAGAVLSSIVVLATFALLYLIMTWLLGIPEARALWRPGTGDPGLR